MKRSVFDRVDIAEDTLQDSMHNGILVGVKEEISSIDDELEAISVHLEAIDGLHTDSDLTLKRTNEFFEEVLPDIIEKLNKLRERLY